MHSEILRVTLHFFKLFCVEFWDIKTAPVIFTSHTYNFLWDTYKR